MFHHIPTNQHHSKNPSGVPGLLHYCYLHFDLNLVRVKCTNRLISCALHKCTDQFDFPWHPTMCDNNQPRYQLL